MTQETTQTPLPLKQWHLHWTNADAACVEELLTKYRRRLVGDNTVVWERIDEETDDDDLSAGSAVSTPPHPNRPSDSAAAVAEPDMVLT